MDEWLRNNAAAKRLGVGVLTMGIIAVNKKLGLNLGVEEVVAIAGVAVSMITGSNLKEAKERAAEVAKEKLNTDADVIKELSK